MPQGGDEIRRRVLMVHGPEPVHHIRRSKVDAAPEPGQKHLRCRVVLREALREAVARWLATLETAA